jgi:hypothetical protein
MCTAVLRNPETPQPPPPPAFGLVYEGRYWSAKIDDISLYSNPLVPKLSHYSVLITILVEILKTSLFEYLQYYVRFNPIRNLQPGQAKRQSAQKVYV